MKVGTQQGNNQSNTVRKSLTDQGHPIDDIAIIVSTLNPPYLLLHLSLVLLMEMKMTLLITTHQENTRVFLPKLRKLTQILRTKV